MTSLSHETACNKWKKSYSFISFILFVLVNTVHTAMPGLITQFTYLFISLGINVDTIQLVMFIVVLESSGHH